MWSWLETSNNKITETQLDEKDDPVTKILNDMVKRDELDNIKEESDEPNEQKEQNEPKESTELNEPTEPESEGESDGTKEAEWEKELDRKSCMNCINCQKTTYIQFTMKRSHLIIFVLSYSINLFLTIYNYTKKH